MLETYVKPNGQEVMVNKNSEKKAESLGWKKKVKRARKCKQLKK